MINNVGELQYKNGQVPFGLQSSPVAQVPYASSQTMEGGQDAYVPETYVANRVKKSSYSWATFPATVAAWLGIAKGMDYFNNKLCSKEYAETPFGKIGAWGDKVSDGYFNSSFAKSSFGQKFHGFLGRTKDFINNKIIGKSKLLTAMKTTPTSPENRMAVAQSKGIFGLHNMEVETLLPSFVEGSEVPQQLERYGMKQDAIDALKKALKGKNKEQRLALLQEEEFKLFNVNTAEALKEAKVKALGFNDWAHYEKISKDFMKNPEEVMKALQNANKDMCITRCSGEGFLGRVQKFLFNRKVTFKELANKYLVVGNTPHKTKLGRGMSKGLAWVLEGMTNRFAGGKMVALMQATFLAEALVATLQADGIKEKGKTFIERNVNTFSYVFAAPLAIMAMHRMGGMKYAGMKPEDVTKFREELKIFNEKAKNGGFATKAEYKAARKELDNMLNAGVKNPITKLFKKAAEVLTVGIEKYRPYKSSAKNNANFMRKSWYWLKEGAGYPIRIGLAMAVLMPLVSKITTQLSNSVFGKPKVSVLDEEGEEGSEEQQANVNEQLARLRQDAIQRQQASAQHSQQMQQYQNTPRMDMLQRYKQGQNQSTIVNNTTNVYGTQNNEQNQQQNKPLRTYIPSPVGVQTVNPQVSIPDDVMKRSMIAEQEALKMLAMH